MIIAISVASVTGLLIVIAIVIRMIWKKGPGENRNTEQLSDLTNQESNPPAKVDLTAVPRGRMWSQTSSRSSSSSVALLLPARNGGYRSPLCSNTSTITEFIYDNGMLKHVYRRY